MNIMNTQKTNWWENLYSDLLAEVLLEDQSNTSLNESIEFLSKTLDLKKGDRIFDQCCGVGNLAIKLSEKGIKISGVDLGENYIEKALTKAQSSGIDLTDFELVKADAFIYKSPKPCNYAINWWTGFGYADSDNQNMEMIKRAYESLIDGGKFVIDFMNVAQVLKDFKEQVVNQKETSFGKVELTRNSRIELSDGHIYKEWIFLLESGEKRIHYSKVKLYLPHQIGLFFEQCGFKNINFYGNIDSQKLSLTSPRCIIVGEK